MQDALKKILEESELVLLGYWSIGEDGKPVYTSFKNPEIKETPHKRYEGTMKWKDNDE